MRIVALCGPPCAGKTTLANNLSRPGDAILDFDDIARALGSPDPWMHPEPYRTMAEPQLRWAGTATLDGTVWGHRTEGELSRTARPHSQRRGLRPGPRQGRVHPAC